MRGRGGYRDVQPDQFPLGFEIAARFSDQDTLRHINNVAIAGIFAEARNMMIREVFQRTERPAGLRFIIAQVGISYLREAHYPAIFTIGSGILAVGTSSFRVCQALFYNGKCTSVAETVMVAANDRASIPLDPEVRDVLAELTMSQFQFAHLLNVDV